jgi:predicted phage tail protein
MTKVYLYGELRNKFGSEFKFQVNSAREAFLAINSNRRGFLDEIKRLGAKSIHYRIVVDDYVLSKPEEIEIKKAPKEIHIVPIVWGAGIETAAAWLATKIGAYVGSAAVAKAIAYTVIYVAAAVAVAGIMTLLFPPPKPNFDQETQAGAKSYLFGNRPNNAAQGQAVPVGYGRLKIAGSQVSAGLSHHPMNLDIKQLMTPVDKPINDYTSLEFENEAPDSTDGLIQDSFSTNQAALIEESVSFASATIVNSYVDIVSKNAYKVTSGPVEVVVKRNGEIVSNIALDSYDEDIEYEWSLIERPARGIIAEDRNVRPSTIKIEKPYAFQNGLVCRSYHPIDYALTTNFQFVENTGRGYFSEYLSGDLVKFGPTQFARLPIGDWDFSTRYFSGQIVRYTTGIQTDVYFQTLITGTGGPFLGFDGTITGIPTNPTGSNGLVRSSYWNKITPPTEEFVYKTLRDTAGLLPSTGGNLSNLPNWTGLFSVATKTGFDQLLSGMPSYKFETIYEGKVEATNEQSVFGGNTNANNYAMELMGYFYVPLSEDLKKQVPDTTPNVMYEIIKVGNTGQWSGIGLTGTAGAAIQPSRGVTFVKNSTQSTGDGVCYPVVKYKFKIDSDDAADLYIDGQLASSWYGNHGLVSPSTPEGVAALPSTTNELLLTAGYHHLYARFQDGVGSDGISFYYQYDTNWDGGYSNFAVIPGDRLKYRQISDLNFSKDKKFISRSWQIPVSSMVSGKQYKILDLGNTTNWTSIGASSPVTGTVFTKVNNTAANGGGYVFEDLYNYAESRSSEQNRVVQFSAERPIINRQYSNGYSSASAEYNCKVTLDGVTLITSPARVKIKMLQTDIPLANLPPATLPIANYRT